MTSIHREASNCGPVLGIAVDHKGSRLNIRAHKAVIIGTGGSTGNVNFRRMFDPRLTEEYCGLAGMPWSDQDASGELTALQVRPDGSAKLVTTTSGFTAADLRNSLGTALILHQGPGNLGASAMDEAGKRVACGVIAAPAVTTTSVTTITTTTAVPPPSPSTSTVTVTTAPTVTSTPTTTVTTPPSLPPGT